MPGLTEIFGMDASWARCTTCGLPFQFPQYLCDWASTHNKPLFCPMGHGNTIAWGDNTPRKMEQRLMTQAEELVSLNRQFISAKGQITKLRNARNKKTKKEKR